MFCSTLPFVSLQPFIESLWYCNRYVAGREETLTLPFGRIEMLIKFSGEYAITHQQETFTNEDLWITGQQSKPTITTISGQHECMGVVFTPLGWHAFSNIWASELTDSSFPLRELWGKEVSALRDELAESKKVEIKFDKIQHYFLKRLKIHENIGIIRQAIRIIEDNRNAKKITVNSLCKELKTSRKSLNHYFQKCIGLSASGYLQQMVFNSIIKDLSTIPVKRLIETGYNYHFFDQAHFIKQFESFSGMPPGQYLQFVKKELIDKSFPNFITL
jgi:AraC-like DNA-binding protein